jgi:ribosomal protein S18 acetylase RimI-like enzyme
MTIRRLHPLDAADFRALRLRALREHPEAFTSSVEEALRRPLEDAAQRLAPDSEDQFWGAFNGEMLVGMVGLHREPREKTRHKALVVAMYVAPEHARRGIGKALLHAVVAQARADGLESLTLTVTVGNHGAERLYTGMGFVSYGIEPRAIQVQGQCFGKNLMQLDLLAQG